MIKSKDIWYVLIMWFGYMVFFTALSSCVNTSEVKPDKLHREFKD